MTTETNAETPGTEEITNPPGQEGTTPPSTDQSKEPPAGGQPGTEKPGAETPSGDDPGDSGDGEGGDKSGDGEGGDAWAGADLDDETRKFVGDKSPAEIAKELMNAQKLLGKKAIGIPGKDSTPEEQRAFHKARGVPDDETGYDLKPAIEELQKIAPEGWAPSEAAEASFRKAARLANLSQGEATQFAQHFLAGQFETQKERMEQEVKAGTEARALMAKEWGPEHKAANEDAFARGMKALGLDGNEGAQSLIDSVSGSGAARFAAVKAIAEIGRRLGEGGPVPGGTPPGGNGAMTKEQARAEMDRIRTDPVLSDAYTNPIHPRHQEVTNEMTRLGKIERGIS